MPKAQGCGQALVLSQPEADAIIDACAPVHRAVFSFARCTAARISEVLSLRFENITPTCVVLPKHIVKGKKKTREVPINARLGKEFARWQACWEATQGRSPEGCTARGHAREAPDARRCRQGPAQGVRGIEHRRRVHTLLAADKSDERKRRWDFSARAPEGWAQWAPTRPPHLWALFAVVDLDALPRIAPF